MSVPYFIYDLVGGAIVQRGHTHDPDMLHLDIQPGHYFKTGLDAGQHTHYQGGQLVTVEQPRPYTEYRELAYPSLAAFADAYYWQANGEPGPMQAWLAACDQVKQTYPKPDPEDT